MRILGIDYGSQRVGVAISDETGRIATPLTTVDRKTGANPVTRTCELATEHGAVRIVVGLPLRLDGTEGDASRRVRTFGAAVEKRAGIPVVFWDERLTSTMANRALDETGRRGQARRKVIDQVAATLILQSYLEATTERTWETQEDQDRIADLQVDAQRDPRGRRPR